MISDVAALASFEENLLTSGWSTRVVKLDYQHRKLRKILRKWNGTASQRGRKDVKRTKKKERILLFEGRDGEEDETKRFSLIFFVISDG